jgi:hypothetical protein
MSITGILSSMYNAQVGTGTCSGRSRMQQVGEDLLAENRPAAKSDFATLQQAFTQSATTSKLASDSARNGQPGGTNIFPQRFPVPPTYRGPVSFVA